MSYEYGAYKNGEMVSINVEDAAAWLAADFDIYRRETVEDLGDIIAECNSTFGLDSNPVEGEETLPDILEDEDDDSVIPDPESGEEITEAETQTDTTEYETAAISDDTTVDFPESEGWILVVAAGGTLPDDVVPNISTEASSVLESSNLDLSGMYITREIQEDGSTIYYAHDKYSLNESTLVWRFSSGAVEVSTDGGKTYPYGFTVTGEMITNIIETIGLKAEWITSGQIGAQRINVTDLFAQDIIATGKITGMTLAGTKGEIGGFTIGEDSLSSENGQIILNAADGTFQLGTETSHISSDGTNITIKADEISLQGDPVITETKVGRLMADKADIDFANVLALEASQAVIQELLVGGGILTEDITAVTGQFTKYLTGVNISGDLINAGTISTERLIIRDPATNEGILFAINNGTVDQANLSPEELKRLTLDGRIITAESITADKIAVTDLSAFRATIGGFLITGTQIRSENNNIVLNSDGSFKLGGLAYNAETKKMGLDLDTVLTGGDDTAKSLGELVVSTEIRYALSESRTECTALEADWKSNIPETQNGKYLWQRTIFTHADGTERITEVCIQGAEGKDGKDATLLRIESSRGTVFKNSAVSTVLSVVIYHGGQRITDAQTMRDVFGAGAYLEWKWQRINEESFGVILSDDNRIQEDGFTFVLSPDDVDAKVTFLCELIV